MKKLAMIIPFSSLPGESGNCRFRYLASMLEDTYDIEFITSSFEHSSKQQRQKSYNSTYPIVLINEPGYRKNISLTRFYSHAMMAKNLKKYLNDKHFDIVYCALPSLDVGVVAAEYAKKVGAKFIIDVQDLWPEAFELIVPIPQLFYLWRKKADKIYAAADAIVAVSQTYANRAKRVNPNVPCVDAFLGTDLSEFDQFAKETPVLVKPDNEIWLGYVGTLGHSYDITLIIEAMHSLPDNIRFVVMGNGPLMQNFQEKALNTNTNFLGRLMYPQMVATLKQCDIAINPIRATAAQSIINKVGDYAMAGLPVVSTQDNPEYIQLLKDYNAGITVSQTKEALVDAILKLANDYELREEMAKNSRYLGECRFNRQEEYKKIIALIEGV